MHKISLAFVDDHPIVLNGLLSLVEEEERFHIAFSTTLPENVIHLLSLHTVDVLLTDVMMPKLSGNMLAKLVAKQFPKVKILALSMSGQADVVNEMINDADISGYVLKNIGKSELITAIEKIARGGIYFSEEVLNELQRTDTRNKERADAHLTTREVEIIRLIEKEFNNRQIAEHLYISERTVETHRKNIHRKTNISSAIGLIKFAYEHNLIVSGT